MTTFPSSVDGELVEGVRNNGLTAYAGSLRARGFSGPEILAALREANRERCCPPLPDFEIRNIAKSAARWKPYPNRSGESSQRAVRIPAGCFDPRPAVCGFDPADIVEQDATLGLWRNHKALYRYLVDIFGPFGCHPALRTIGQALSVPHQHVARHVSRLERAGLLLTEAGEYRQTERRFAARAYHFRRHELFAEHFTRRGLPVFSDLDGFCHHLGEFSTACEETSLENQRVTELLSHRGDVVPITHDGPLVWDQKILYYFECASGCGGCRIVYGDGTGIVKAYPCSCPTNIIDALTARVVSHRAAMAGAAAPIAAGMAA